MSLPRSENCDRVIQFYQAEMAVRAATHNKIQAIVEFEVKSNMWASARQTVESRDR